jgi:hypothetical protein
MSNAAKTKAVPKHKPTPAPANEASLTDEVREAQKAYLLLQLLNADNQTLTRGDGNKFRDTVKKSLNFTQAAMANYRRERLAEMNYIKITPGRSVQYTLLPDGLEYLSACITHLKHVELRIKGETLNKLIEKAREPSFRQDPKYGTPTVEELKLEPVELAETVMAEFQAIRRESYSDSGMVPIHEVRERIAKRLGPISASHAVLDEVILQLWREKRIGLEGISDLGKATEQQLNDSIPNSGNTIFYLEVPREQPVLA